MKYVLAVAVILFIAYESFSQNKPVPDYVTQQDFPDSVKALGIEDLSGSRITFGALLESYKGKKVVIDIWASWCRDCIVGYPKLEKLKRSMSDEDVAFVFLSADKDKEKWKNAITKYNIVGDHYVLDGAWTNSLSNYIVLDWVPRYFVIDENGKVIMPKAIVADDPRLKEAVGD
jgi:thiol-disulfide isomerase/thioredoxin